MMTASGVLWSGFDYRLQGGFDTDCSFVAVQLNQLCSARSWSSRNPKRPYPGTHGRACHPAADDFDTDRPFLATRINQLQGTVIGRASRGETTVQMPGMCIPGAGRRRSANTFH